jgi:hydrogenase-4 component B
MNQALVLAGIGLAALSGLPGLLSSRTGRAGERLAAFLMGVAAILAGTGAVLTFTRGAAEPPRAAWNVPGGELVVRLDAVSAVFVLQIFVGAALGAVYGLEYWSQRDHPESGQKLRLFYGLVVAGMGTVVVAGNGILFLVGWEVMALAAFPALTAGDEGKETRAVGYLYLAATHLGSLCLFAMFALLSANGSDDFGAAQSLARSAVATAVFVLGLVGFGCKAGIVPLHVWLPGAHARAPTHVSAMMSGTLLKIGVYGLVRLGSMFAAPPLWYGLVVLALGCTSAVLGVVFAIGQHDLKRLLAYHSVENVGIIFMGLGVALLGKTTARPELVTLGLAGALLHVWNHGLFKSLLFLSAGSVIRATHTREIDELGGLLPSMPRTAALFLVGATAICGLPPLNGFVSELFIYLGLAGSMSVPGGSWWTLVGLGIPVLALVGALAAACFAKAFGAVFLGSPRSPHASGAREAGLRMVGPMVILAAACGAIGVAPVLVAPALDSAVRAWAGGAEVVPLARVAPLSTVSLMAGLLALVLAALALWLRRKGPVSRSVTWDCGYAAPSQTMQYTSSSFAEGLVNLFSFVLWPRTQAPVIERLFPARAAFRSEVPDTVLDRALMPLVNAVVRLLAPLRWFQRGNVQLYLAYIVAAIVVLMLWVGWSA